MISSARVIEYREPRSFPLLVFREHTDGDGAKSPEVMAEAESASHWAHVHERLVAIGRQRAAQERDLCRWLLAAERLAVHARAGHGSLREYAERVIGLNGRQTEERLRVGRALAALPRLDRALASGQLSWSAVRELTRVATPQTEQAWCDFAKHRRVHEIEKAVAARQSGEGPQDRANPSLIKHRLAFDVRAETRALFRDLQSRVRADLGGDIDDDTLLYEIARRALGGPTDDGHASYQVAVTRCDDCGRTQIDAAGESHRVDDVIGEMAACDAQHLAGPPTRPSTRPHEDEPSPHVGATVPTRPRASQTIPPATRRAVLRRDHKRCVVPGCTHHRFLDVHHLDPRSEGGTHDPDRLAVLCGSHHRAVHTGALCIEGSGAAGFAFRHADGSPYGAPVRPPAVDVAREVLAALEHLGFKATQARALVDKALGMVTQTDAVSLLGAALRVS